MIQLQNPEQIFIADTCIGGLSVLKSLWKAGCAGEAVFMADYSVNPLGVKSDDEIAEVVDKWLGLAGEHSDTLVIACNTLSIRFHQLLQSGASFSTLGKVVSMVDCFTALVRKESARLAGSKVLIIGTEFTANQGVYPDIFKTLTTASVSTVAATELERRIARFESLEKEKQRIFTDELVQAIEQADFAILACTCFPMARLELESLFPRLVFLDPGEYCSGLLDSDSAENKRKLSMKVLGEVVSNHQVTEFARSYLDTESVFQV